MYTTITTDVTSLVERAVHARPTMHVSVSLAPPTGRGRSFRGLGREAVDVASTAVVHDGLKTTTGLATSRPAALEPETPTDKKEVN
jgi:hypothetical protein